MKSNYWCITGVFLWLIFFPAFLLAQKIVPKENHSHMHDMKNDVNCSNFALECAASATPWMDSNGTLWLVWNSDGAIVSAYSTDLGKTFSTPIVHAQHGKYIDKGMDSRPKIIGDDLGHILISYAFFKDAHWNAKIHLIRSDDSGKSFSKPFSLSSDPGSQRFPSLTLSNNHQLLITWLDKRFVASEKKKGQNIAASVMYLWSPDMGQSFSKEALANQSSCECCQIATSKNTHGLPVIFYRANYENTTRDHSIQTFEQTLRPSPPLPISDDKWVTNVCPHQGPALSISSTNSYHVAWFTEGERRQGLFYANSTDEGRHFSIPRSIKVQGALATRPNLFSYGKKVWLTWKEFDGKKTNIYVQSSINDGLTWQDPVNVVQATGYTDHPILIADKKNVYLSLLTKERGYQMILMGEK